jgi:competence protein ComEC
MGHITFVSVVLLLSLLLLLPGASTPIKTLDIYVVDVEGGNATLIVSPSSETLLIDTGNLGAPVRDAERILGALKDAGLTQIDHLITTHWHLDHFGGMTELARHVPIREFIDHGANTQPNAKVDEFLRETYPLLHSKADHTEAKAGDIINVAGVDVRVVTSAGKRIQSSLADGGMPNPYCASVKPADPDPTENSQSIGTYIRFGRFRALHLGDLSARNEFDLMCPIDRIGTVDLFIVSHHGQPNSNTKVLVHAIEPRVAIMNNGIRKGGEPEVMRVIHSAPGLEDLWQLHFSELSGQEYTVPGMFIANHADQLQPFVRVAPMPWPKSPEVQAYTPTHDGKAYWIKVSARADGSFTVTNSRTNFLKSYRARAN